MTFADLNAVDEPLNIGGGSRAVGSAIEFDGVVDDAAEDFGLVFRWNDDQEVATVGYRRERRRFT